MTQRIIEYIQFIIIVHNSLLYNELQIIMRLPCLKYSALLTLLLQVDKLCTLSAIYGGYKELCAICPKSSEKYLKKLEKSLDRNIVI
jgi:hypothetical protein